ncbi:MAG TPA: prenyltransferase [Marinagarivorans sp.]
MHPTLRKLKLDTTADYIKSLQLDSGAILWNADDKLDPWDHVEAAMGLTVAGLHCEAKRAYQWLADNQLEDGSWHANYYFGQTAPKSALSAGKETNFIAYVATGVWHYYTCTGEQSFLVDFFPVMQRALDFVLQFQHDEGEISWAVTTDNQPEPDALLTACSSIARSLEYGIHAARVLGQPTRHWHRAWQRLSHTVRHKPERFDRTWESKQRFAMDWYYPVLAGLYPADAAARHLEQRWPEFVEQGLGCRCVSDEPWVTMAETSELVIALMAAGQRQLASRLFDTLAQWRQSDGGYVTGYVFRDDTIWPEEKTSWTAGAVLLAADALYSLTPASRLFTRAAFASASCQA